MAKVLFSTSPASFNTTFDGDTVKVLGNGFLSCLLLNPDVYLEVTGYYDELPQKFKKKAQQDYDNSSHNSVNATAITLNPRAISSVINAEDAYFSLKDFRIETDDEKQMYDAIRSTWGRKFSKEVIDDGDIETPFIIVKTTSKELYLIPSTQEKFDDSLTVANQVLNGMYNPSPVNKQRLSPLRKRAANLGPGL